MKMKTKIDKKYVIYTLIFLGMLLTVYFYMIYGSMSTAPKFTYAQF